MLTPRTFIIRLSFFLLSLCTSTAFADSNEDKTLYNLINFSPTSQDIVYATKGVDLYYFVNLYEGLMSRNPDNEIIKGQVHSYTVSEDKKTYEFVLRDDIYWSDGKPVIAADFELSFKRILDHKLNAYSKPDYLLSIIKNGLAIANKKADIQSLGIKVIDKKTLRFELEAPAPYFLDILTSPALAPTPSHIVNASNYYKKTPENQVLVSNGPYVYVKHEGNNIYVAKNPKYYDADQVYFEKIVYHTLTPVGSGLSLFSKKKYYLIPTYTANMAEVLEKTSHLRDVQLLERGDQTTVYLAINSKMQLKRDVRAAMSLAVDRKELISRIQGPNFSVAYTFAADMPTINWTGTPPDWSEQSLKQRISEARSLMEKSGYSASKRLKVKLEVNSSTINENLANAIKSYWNKIYIDVETASVLGRQHYINLAQHNFQVARAAWYADFYDPINFLDKLHSKSKKNYAGWSDPAYDEIVERTIKEKDPAARLKNFHQLEKKIQEDVPIIPIYRHLYLSVLSSQLYLPKREDTQASMSIVKYLRPKNSE